MSETKQSGGGSSLMDHGNNRQTPGEFAGQALCASLSSMPNLTGVERALLSCIEKIIMELSNSRTDLDEKDQLIFEFGQQNESLQMDLDWCRTELAKKEEELKRLQKGVGPNKAATSADEPARKRVKREVLDEATQQQEEIVPVMGDFAASSHQSYGKVDSHRQDHGQSSSAAVSTSNLNALADEGHQASAFFQGQQIVGEQAILYPPAQQFVDVPSLIGQVFSYAHSAALASQQAAAAAQQQQQVVAQQQMPVILPSKEDRAREKRRERQEAREEKAERKKMVQRARLMPRGSPRIAKVARKHEAPTTTPSSPIDLHGISLGVCYNVVNTHKTRRTDLYKRALIEVEAKMAAEKQKKGVKSSKDLKRMMNRLLLEQMAKMDWDAFWREYK